MSEELYWVATPRATYGVVVVDNKIIIAAPIANRFLGRTLQHIRDYYTDLRIKYEIRKVY